MHTYLTKWGFKPCTHWLDNEAAQIMDDFDTDNDVTYKPVPPVMHRRNKLERCIITFKNHLLAGPIGTDDQLPLHLWHRIILQATITLNMLRPSWQKPNISAHMELEGAFDCNKTPQVPPGTKVVVHKNPNKRASWASNGVHGWYLGPEMDHYRCYRVYVNSDTIDFSPQHAKVPGIAAINAETTATQQLVTYLSNTKPNTSVEKVGHWKLAALHVLAQIFQHTAAMNKPGFEAPKHTAKPRVEA